MSTSTKNPWDTQQPNTNATDGLTKTAQDMQGAIKETAQETIATASGAVEDLVEQTKGQASDIVTNAAEQLGDTMTETKAQVASAFDTQRDRTVASLTGIAEALRTAGDKMGSTASDGAEIPAAIGPMVRDAADRLAQSAEFLRNKDVSSLLSEARALAQRQPVAFIGTMFALGIAGARLLTDSSGGATPPAPASPNGSSTATDSAVEMEPGKERFETSTTMPTDVFGATSQPTIGGLV